MFSEAVLVMLLLNKPHCTKKNHGQLWPPADRTTIQYVAHSGTLEMCVSSMFGYKWQHLTVVAPHHLR
jgi:hypothetical protein